MKKFIFCCLFAMAVTAVNSYQHVEARMLEVNLQKMTGLAGRIVAGRCMGIEKGFHPEYPRVKVTFVEIDIFDTIKGSTKTRFKFMQHGHGYQMSHTSSFKEGEDILLFLYPESQYGFTSPVGGNQGKLSIGINSESGKPVTVSVLNSNKLFSGLDSNLLSNTTENKYNNLKPGEKDAGLMNYDAFKSIILSVMNNTDDMEVNR